MTGLDYGVRTSTALLEPCPSCKLNGRTTYLMAEVDVYPDAIDARLVCPVLKCKILVRRPTHRSAETGHPRSRVHASFTALRRRVFTPRIIAMTGVVMALFAYLLFA